MRGIFEKNPGIELAANTIRCLLINLGVCDAFGVAGLDRA